MPTFKPFDETFANQKPTSQQSVDKVWKSWSMQEFQHDSTESLDAAAMTSKHEFKAQDELKELKDQARKEAYEEAYTKGENEGFEQGYKEGLIKGEQEGKERYEAALSEAINPLNSMLSQLEDALTTINDQLAESIVQLAVTVGKQLAGEALAVAPEEVLSLIREIIHEDPMLADRPTLLLHPDDAALVEQHLSQELSSHGWRMRADERIDRGGCRLVSAQGELDATIDTRWERIVERLRARQL